MTLRRSWLFPTVCSALIFAGFIQPIAPGFMAERVNILVRVAYFLSWSAPLVPAATVLMRLAMLRPASLSLVWSATIIAFLTGMVLTLFGLAFASALSGPLLLTQGSVLSLAVASGILWLASGQINRGATRLALAGMALSAAVAVWSLLSVPAVVFQAHQTAAGSPFCITHHNSSSVVNSLWDLRGFSFYTTASGYKSTSTWYFHGILIVDGDDGLGYFNWSPRHFQFDRIDHPERFIASLENLCTPSSAFWAELW